jgi:hypothetical protein
MTSPAPASAPPSIYPPQKSGNGCLWGCLILMLILFLPPVLLGGYGAWFLYDGYKHNPVLRVIGEMVRKDGMAQQVMGHGAMVTGVEGNVFSWFPGSASDTYQVALEGPKGEGHVTVTSHHSGFDAPTLDSVILTGPDGQRYDLLKHRRLPEDRAPPPDTSI